MVLVLLCVSFASVHDMAGCRKRLCDNLEGVSCNQIVHCRPISGAVAMVYATLHPLRDLSIFETLPALHGAHEQLLLLVLQKKVSPSGHISRNCVA